MFPEPYCRVTVFGGGRHKGEGKEPGEASGPCHPQSRQRTKSTQKT